MAGTTSGPMMKACRVHRYGGPEVVVLEEVPVPEPGAGEVRVRVAATGIGPWDGWIRGGLDASSSSNDLTLDGVCADYTGQHLTMKYTATPTTFSALESNGKLSVYTKN